MLLHHSSADKLKNRFLASQRKLHLYEKGEEIPLFDQGIWCVHRGVVQLSEVNCLGGQTLLGWCKEESFFGLLFTSLDTFQAQAISDVYLQWYSAIEIEQNPELVQTLLTQIIMRNKQTEKLLAIAGLKTVEHRLKELLLLISRYLGEPRHSGVRIRVKLTHQNLADAINTTRVTVTRLLGDLQKQDLIRFDSQRHLYINVDSMT